MKRYINAGRYVGYSVDELRDQLRAYRHDRRWLAKCETVEDVMNGDWWSWRFDKFISSDIEKGEDFDDIIDGYLDSLQAQIQQLKKDVEDAFEYEDQVKRDFQVLRSFCKRNYNLIGESDYSLLIAPPEGATQKDCINFVDDLVSAIDGEYVETGRGGSWSVWNICSYDGARFKAGWKDKNWFVEIY